MSREEFYGKIELLVKMAGAKISNAENLNAELDEIKEELASYKASKKALKQSMNEDRYFDAASEIVDRNLVIGLKKQIAKLNSDIENNANLLDENIKKEESLHMELFNVESLINDDTNYINGLESRIAKLSKTGLSEDIEHYNESLRLVKKTLEEEKNTRDETNKLYTETLKGIDECSDLSEKLNIRLEELNNKLKETNESLKNKDAYVNEELKTLDEFKLNEIEEHIKELEERKLKIINDPVYIATEIKEALDADDMISSMNKTKDLINNVSKLPFMEESDMEKLKDTLRTTETEKNDFVQYIENKKYDEINTDTINDRIVYLNSVISSINEEIDSICKRIAKVDNGSSQIATNLEKTIEQRDNLIADIELYQAIIDTEEHLPVRRKNIILNILEKKKEQANVINRIIESYKKEELKAIENITNLENSTLQDLKDQIKLIEIEKAELNKNITNLKIKNKDILAEENDKEILKDFDDRISLLNNRLAFDESLDSIRTAIDEFFVGQKIINEKEEPLEVKDNEFENKDEAIEFVPIDSNLPKDNKDIEFIDFDDNKFLEIPESNVVKIDDILSDTEKFEPLFAENDEVINLFEDDKESTDDLKFESVTSFDLPKFELPKEEPILADSDLLEVINVTPIIVEDKKDSEA